jgi:hypothetical protein
MNCKPRDLAVVIRPSKCGHPPRVGAVVRVAEISWMFPDCWVTDPPIVDPADGREVHIEDIHLRPIRDPGDDAVDESAAWLPPVPLPTILPEMIPAKEEA